MIYKLKDFKIASTGSGGGNCYVIAQLNMLGQTRTMTVFFKSAYDEALLKNKTELMVKGSLMDEGSQQSLILLDAELMNN